MFPLKPKFFIHIYNFYTILYRCLNHSGNPIKNHRPLSNMKKQLKYTSPFLITIKNLNLLIVLITKISHPKIKVKTFIFQMSLIAYCLQGIG